MIKYVFILSFFFLSLKLHYFVTFLENPENFLLLKNNIGFIHKYYKNSFAIIVLDTESKRFSEIIDQISFWKQVHILDQKHIFLYSKHRIASNISTKVKLGTINYIFENYFFSSGTKVFCFDIFVSLFKSRNSIFDIFTKENISYSENHLLLNNIALNNELAPLMINIRLNTFGAQDYNFLNKHYINLKSKKDEVRNNTLSCRIIFKNLHYSALYFDEPQTFSAAKNHVAILLPTLSANSNIDENPLIKHTIPSLSKTISRDELQNLNITIYIAYDNNDVYFKTENSIELHKKKIVSIFGKSEQIYIKYIKFPVSKSVVFLWNALFVQSYKDGNDYFVQLNDDTEINKSEWLTESIKYFKNGFDGLIGFNSEEWGCKLFTQTIVSKMHYKRNSGNFYPILFQNAMSDIWITEFYKNNKKCLYDYKTNNHFSKTRYRKCPFNRRLLKKVLKSFDTKY